MPNSSSSDTGDELAHRLETAELRPANGLSLSTPFAKFDYTPSSWAAKTAKDLKIR